MPPGSETDVLSLMPKPEQLLRLDQDTTCLDHAHREENVEKEISVRPPLQQKKGRSRNHWQSNQGRGNLNSNLSSSCNIFWSPSEAKDRSVACLVCGKKGLEPLTAITASIRQQESLEHKLAAMTLNSSSDPLWYSDSGASNHVTDKPENQLGMIPYRGHCMVYTGYGSPLPISHMGTASISTTLGKLAVPGSKSK